VTHTAEVRVEKSEYRHWLAPLFKHAQWRSSKSRCSGDRVLAFPAWRGVGEALDRISGAFAKLRIPESQVYIQVNLIPHLLEKDWTWLDLPLAEEQRGNSALFRGNRVGHSTVFTGKSAMFPFSAAIAVGLERWNADVYQVPPMDLGRRYGAGNNEFDRHLTGGLLF
jgi:hypothetical protein